ncbi:hypothetical protein ACW4TU_42105 [Streptomyces sp. QTS52]
MTRALDACFGELLRPHWPRIRDVVRRDVELRVRAMLGGGVQALLNGFCPPARWDSPVLEVAYPVDREPHLDGRGLLLVPSFFCWRRPTAIADPALPPVLVCPVPRTPLDGVRATDDGVALLLGRTRAAVLAEFAHMHDGTSSDVAEAVGISPASVSYQLGFCAKEGS